MSLLMQVGSDASTGTIVTLAGGGAGDQILAEKASLSSPTNVAADSDGNVYIADTGHHTIRRVDPSGYISTVAGTGVAGFSGDGGPAIKASLRGPEGIAVDPDGNIYVSDTKNNRIRKIDTFGVMSTIAGIGVAGYVGEGIDANLAALSGPEGLALAADGLLIADSGNHVVRKIDLDGKISTLAGTGIAGSGIDGLDPRISALNHPESLAVASDGSVFVADTNNHKIRRISSGTMTTFVGTGSAGYAGDGGPAVSAALQYPESIALSSSKLFIGDSHNRKIRVVEAGVINTVAGSGERGWSGDGGPAPLAKLSLVAGLAIMPNGSLIFADTRNHRVRRVSPIGTMEPFAGSGQTTFLGDDLPATWASLNRPGDIAHLPDGDLLIADTHNHRIRRVSAVTGVITTFAGNGSSAFSGDGGAAANASFSYPAGLAVDPDGTVYVADSSNRRIRKIDPSGVITTFAGGGTSYGSSIPATSAQLQYPSGMDVGLGGDLFVADAGANKILRIDSSGQLFVVAGGKAGFAGDGGPSTSALLHSPIDVDVAHDGSLYIADKGNHRIRRISPEGIISTVAGNGMQCFYGDGGPATSACLSWPSGVVAQGDAFVISDTSNYRVREVGSDGTIRTVAGNGYWGYSGDGKAATSAALSWPGGIQIDQEGRLYICDGWNKRIRMVQAGW